VSIVCVIGVSHLGHSATSGNYGRIFTLGEQVAHKVSYIRQLLEQQPNTSIILVCCACQLVGIFSLSYH
jgi:hypothetical protein